MSDQHTDLLDFLQQRFQDRSDGEDIPDKEILDALTEWMETGYPAPSISVTYHRDGSVTVAGKETP